MPAAVARHRAFLLLASAVLYPAIFVAFLAVERPGIGVAHLFYFPVAMIALAAGPYFCSRLTTALADEGLSMSFGWAVCPRDGNSPLLLFRAADERLYAQKLIRSRLSAAEVVDLPSRAERLRLRTQSG
jgi:GGDEF domain-containing protein